MARPTPMHWIEEAEAREVMIAALFEEPSRRPRRRRMRDRFADRLARIQEWLADAMPAPPLQAQPVPVRRPNRRPPPARDFGC